MKIDYTYADARRIEEEYFIIVNSEMRPMRKQDWSAGFQCALEMCGVKFIRDYVRIYAPDGNDFPQSQVDEYNKSKIRKVEEVA